MEPPIAAVVRDFACGRVSPGIALIRLLGSTGGVRELGAALDRAARSDTADALLQKGIGELRAALQANLEGSARAAALLREHDSLPPCASTDEELARWRDFFDWSVGQSPEASVALWSLCDSETLAAATRELVTLLHRMAVLRPNRRVLEIGCGIGRFLEALSGAVEQIAGIDISPGMVSVARERCRGLSNVRVLECSGRDLSMFDARSFDLVLALDVMPYAHRAGGSLVTMLFEEAARVLAPGGDLVIVNFSYRGNVELDRRDVRELAAATGFLVLRNGGSDLRLSDGLTFHLRRTG